MKIWRHVFVLLFVIFSLASCAYYPHLTDIPLINKKGDTRVEGGVTVPAPSVHATVSHGLTDKIAIQGAGTIGGDDTYDIQGAVGLFKSLQNQEVIELYGGVSYGYGYASKSSQDLGRLDGNYQVYFTQFNYGKINGSFANRDYGVGLKLGYYHASMNDRSYYDYGLHSIRKFNGLLIEPVFMYRFGGKRLKFQTEMGGCWIFLFNNEKKLPFFPLNLGIGMSYSL